MNDDMGMERWVGVAAGLAVGLAALYYMYGPRIQDKLIQAADEPPVEQAPLPPAAPAPAPAPVTQAEAPAAPAYPAPKPAARAPASEAVKPARKVAANQDIAVSDVDVRETAAAVFGVTPIEAFLVPDRVIQNFVTTVDSLDREPVPLKHRVIANVPQVPVVERRGNKILLSSDNDERYRVLGNALRATQGRTIADAYLRYYPLFDRAYRELGYPDGNFNDRVVQVIDHLLATPEVNGPIELVRPKVLYLFADPDLEQLSSGQKIMIRIGAANATAAKQRLREVREVITGGTGQDTARQQAAGRSATPAKADPASMSAMEAEAAEEPAEPAIETADQPDTGAAEPPAEDEPVEDPPRPQSTTVKTGEE